MGYISDSKSYREYMMMMEREQEILTLKNRMQHTKDNITNQVIEDLKARADRGYKKYNTTLNDNNKDDYMNHLYEELLDAAQYIKKEMSIIPELQQMIEQHSNDITLGEAIRSKYAKHNV
jgi:hypothetical protein